MPNPYVLQRLDGIKHRLNGVHKASIAMSSASKGEERQQFIEQFLCAVLPPVYRFGRGDATDCAGNRSGQLDVVMEYPFGPSLPTDPNSPRLYLAESVAAVIEVKSDLSSQWTEAESTGAKLAPVQRSFGVTMTVGGYEPPSPTIPLFAVGYTGWTNIETLKSRVNESSNVMGALILDSGLYYCKDGVEAWGPWSLWGLICSLHAITAGLTAAQISPINYAI